MDTTLEAKGEDNMAENPVSCTKTIFVQVVERPARKITYKRGQNAEHYFEYCEEVVTVHGMYYRV